MTTIRSSICSGTSCKAAPFAHGKEGGKEYRNISKAWYLTAAISGMRTMQNTESPTSGQGSQSSDSGYLKTMLSDGPRFDNGLFKAMVNAGVSERPCRSLCAESKFTWEKKCSWSLTCSGCSECDESPVLALSRATDANDCDAAKFLQPHAVAVQQFAKDEAAWLQAFMEAWWIGTTNSQGGLSFLISPTNIPAKAGKCGRLRKRDRCAHLGCAWNGTLCAGGVELSWGVKWNELHMLAPKLQPAPKSQPAAAIVHDWEPPMTPRSVSFPPPAPTPPCSSPLVDRVTPSAHHVGDWGGLCTCASGGAAWVGDVAPCEDGNTTEALRNRSHDHREPESGAACMGGTVTQHQKKIGEWSHKMMQCGVCMDACDEPVPRLDTYNEEDMNVGVWGGRCMCPSGIIFQVGVKEDGTMACENGVGDMLMEHGGPWSHKSAICHPCPAPGWTFTGSWGPGVPGTEYTDGWGSPNGTEAVPPSLHPTEYSMLGSNNEGSAGYITILSGEFFGWTVVVFSGSLVLKVEVV